MTQYTLLDPVTGYQRPVSALGLIQNIRLNCIILRDGEHLGIITHRDLVLFTRWCAGEMMVRLKGKPDQSAVHVLRLVDKWLEDERSVTSKELEAARNAAWAARTIASLAAAQAAWAALTIAQPHEAVWAAEAASAATRGWVSYETQVQWLVEHLQS